MRHKIILSSLAFVAALLLSGFLHLSMCAQRLLPPSEYARFSSVILSNAILHADVNGGYKSLKLAEWALSGSFKTGWYLTDNGRSYSFSLPKYSIWKERRTYLTFATFDELQTYFHEDLPKAGWHHVDQMGAGHFFEGNGAKMIITHHFYLGTGICEFSITITDCVKE